MTDPRRAALAAKIKTKVTRLTDWELEGVIDAVFEMNREDTRSALIRWASGNSGGSGIIAAVDDFMKTMDAKL